MPILPRRTRRLLRLLFGLKKKSKLDWIFGALPFLVWGCLIAWYYLGENGENKWYGLGIVTYLYFEMQFRRMESDHKSVMESIRLLKRESYYTRLKLERSNDRRVKVDMNDMFAEGQRWKQNQARHRAQRR